MKESKSEPQRSLPSIIFVGSPNVGKRTLLSRLISVDLEDTFDSPSQELIHGWTINTKYYTADVSVCVAHFHDGFSIKTLPAYSQLVAIIMVVDMNDRSSLVALQDWVSRNDLQRFEILVCVGNKVDLIPGHPVHSEYRRRVLKVGDFSSDNDSDYYGISEVEGSGLLGEGDGELSSDIRKSCLEWCTEHHIEFVEACGSNADFDKCLSADGDSQGVERLFGALSAHMWPGMILKSGDKIAEPSLPEREDLSDEESDYEIEYEKLSTGSAEPWDDTEDPCWISSSGDIASSSTEPSVSRDNQDVTNEITKPSIATSSPAPAIEEEPSRSTRVDESSHFDFNELEQLMSEIGNIRENLRLMPDFQRREMAANVALKMATMFGGGSDDDEEILM